MSSTPGLAVAHGAQIRHPVRAERLRWRRSTAARLPLLGLFAATVQGCLYLAGSTRHDWSALTAWQILWVSFLGPIEVALLAGLLARRETRARGGGAWWRPITPRRVHRCAFLVLAGYALALQGFVLLVALPFGWVDGLSFPGPLTELARLCVIGWGATLALLALAHQLACRLGVFASVALAFGWAVAGTLTAETGTWWAQPWAWSVRASLPLLGTHANGIRLSSGDPVAGASPWPAAGLSVMLAIAIVAVVPAPTPSSSHHRTPTMRRRRERTAPGESGPDGAPWARGVTPALLASLRRTAAGPLVLATFAAVGLAAPLASPSTTTTLAGLIILPVGAVLLPVLVWQAQAPAWRILSARPAGPRRLATGLLGLMALTLTGLALITAAATWLDGLPARRAALFAVLLVSTGLMLLSWQFWLVVRYGTGPALALGALGVLLAIVVGGTGLADTLWPVVPWSWALSAQPGTRAVLATPAGLLLAAAGLLATRHAAHRAAG